MFDSPVDCSLAIHQKASATSNKFPCIAPPPLGALGPPEISVKNRWALGPLFDRPCLSRKKSTKHQGMILSYIRKLSHLEGLRVETGMSFPTNQPAKRTRLQAVVFKPRSDVQMSTRACQGLFCHISKHIILKYSKLKTKNMCHLETLATIKPRYLKQA